MEVAVCTLARFAEFMAVQIGPLDNFDSIPRPHAHAKAAESNAALVAITNALMAIH